MAESRSPVIPATVQTEVEKPGIVMVEAVASAERQLDGRAVAGFFVRRRYHGERFMIASPQEFSLAWMRFVDQPPDEWVKAIREQTGVIDGKRVKIHADFDPNDYRAEEPTDPRAPSRPFAPMSMGDVARQGKQSHEFNYATGKVGERASP